MPAMVFAAVAMGLPLRILIHRLPAPAWLREAAIVLVSLLLMIPAGWFAWHLPVWRERLRNRFRRCRQCGARDWKIGGRGFGL